MNYFTYKDNRLFAEDVAISDLAARLGTPLYIYSARTLRRHYRVLSEAFEGKGLVERHQAVYTTLGDAMRARIHALSLATLTPIQYSNRR